MDCLSSMPVIDMMKEKIAEGKKLKIKGDIAGAVSCYQEALQNLTEHYGDLAPECAEAYHLYGTTMLELVKGEASFMAEDSAGPKDDDEDDDDEDETHGADGDSAACSSSKVEESAEEVSDLQVVWESLEAARIIYSKDPSPSTQLKLAWVYFDLGEYKLETGLFPDAVEEFTTCLQIRHTHLKPTILADARLIAEVSYNLGCAEQHAKNFTRAIAAYMEARATLQLFLKDLPPLDAEFENLTSVIEDINQKIEDARDEARGVPTPGNILEAASSSVAKPAAVAAESSCSFAAPTMAPASSTLVVRKRPKVAETSVAAPTSSTDSSKKVKVEDTL